MTEVPSSEPKVASVLFVCLGNICRSPLAEAIFRDLVGAHGLASRIAIDSCGLGSWHVGKPADSRAIAAGTRHGLGVTSIARVLDPRDDFARFTWLIAMDGTNRRELLARGAPASRVHLMRSFDDSCACVELDVPDPYHGDDGDFDEVVAMLRPACVGLLERVRAEITATA